jgi:hypothetical protein
MVEARLFFRAIECDDGSWACRHGRQEFDRHARMQDALGHVTELAVADRPAEVFVHYLDGRVHSAAVFAGVEPPEEPSP